MRKRPSNVLLGMGVQIEPSISSASWLYMLSRGRVFRRFYLCCQKTSAARILIFQGPMHTISIPLILFQTVHTSLVSETWPTVGRADAMSAFQEREPPFLFKLKYLPIPRILFRLQLFWQTPLIARCLFLNFIPFSSRLFFLFSMVFLYLVLLFLF